MQIEEVDYKKLPGYASEMRKEGVNLNTQLTNAYTKMGTMSKDWYGVRYDALVDECNKIVPQINEMLNLVIDTIPFTLQTIANNYAKVDGGSTAAATNQKAKNITNVKKSGKTTMRFVEASVSSDKSNIFGDFRNAQDKMTAIEQIFNSKIKNAWKSDASNQYAKKFATLKNEVSTSISNIQKSFDQLMQQALDDMKKTEQANTVS